MVKIVLSLLHICFQKMFTGVYNKRFINLDVLKLFTRFLHLIITMLAFQAGTVASIIVQFRKFSYQTLHETKNLYKLHKQKHGKCNFVQ